MIDFSGDTYANLLNTMMGNVPNTYDKREGGIIQTAIGPAAYAFEEFYMTLNQVQQAAYVQTAVGSSLDMIAVIANITRYPASAAVRLGVFNQPIPLGSRFSTVNGDASINFIATAATDNPNQFQLTAETVGTIGNDYTGSILPITYIQGLTTAQITDILVPGDDEETDDEFRQRLITALNEKPFGGNVAAYREYVGGIDGVGGVQVYPTWNGGGTVKLSVIGADWNPASPTLVENVQNAVDPPPNQGLGLGMAPIGAQVTVVAPTTVTINVEATLTLSPGYEIGQVQTPVETAISNYLLGIRENWATPLVQGGVEYASNVFVAQVIAAIIGVTGVVNATNVTLNGGTADIALTQTGTTQQVPIIGTVTLNVGS